MMDCCIESCELEMEIGGRRTYKEEGTIAQQTIVAEG
jgi:hypothetical protein